MNTTNRVLPVLGAAAGIMFLAFGVALTASCRGSDQVAPEGSTITLAANPATIPIATTGGSGSSDVVATVYSAAGVPQEDQDVRFSSSAGSLFTPAPDNQPAANIPIPTDNLGNAHVTLVTTTSTTVTARSGLATGTLTLTTVPGNLNNISLSQVFSPASCMPDSNFVTCNDTLCLEAQATDLDSNPVIGLQVVFQVQNIVTSNSSAYIPVFQPTSTVTTDGGGFAHVQFTLGGSNCPAVCGSNQTCEGDLVVSLQGGGFVSGPVHFTTSIQ